MAYFIYVSVEKGAPERIYGPYDTFPEAENFGKPFAEEGLYVRMGTDTIICDFCSSSDVAWGYPSKDFQVVDPDLIGGAWGSTGGWAACDYCHTLIEAGDREGLLRHSIRNFFDRNQDIPEIPQIRRLVIRHVTKIHSLFFVASFGQTAQRGKDEPPSVD